MDKLEKLVKEAKSMTEQKTNALMEFVAAELEASWGFSLKECKNVKVAAKKTETGNEYQITMVTPKQESGIVMTIRVDMMGQGIN